MSVAQWINSTFYGFDHAILEFYHNLAKVADPICRPISEFFAFIGDGALACFVIAAIMLLFAKTRKSGICIFFSVGISSLITNVIIKRLVARPRPYAAGVEDYSEWWEFVGEHMQSEFSFPSGHTTAAMAGAFAICLCLCLFNSKENNKKYRWVLIPAILYVIVVGASRNYLMVHYPTDIVGGIIAGGIGATLAFLLIHFLYKGLEGNRDSKFCAFMLDADVKNLFKKHT